VIGWARFQRSIRDKVLLAMLATTFAALSVTAVVLVVYDYSTYRSGWVGDLTSQAQILAHACAPAIEFDDPNTAMQYLESLAARQRILAAAVYTTDGRPFATYVRAGSTGVTVPPAPGPEGTRVLGNTIEYVGRIQDPVGVVGTVYLLAKYQLTERLRRYAAIVGAVMLMSLLVAFIVSVRLQSNITGPILAVRDAARRVSRARDYSLRAAKASDDEVGELADAFNDMLAEIGRRAASLEREMAVRQEAENALREADRRKDEFLATLAHELRNPLAPMRNAIEILRRDATGDAPSRAAREVLERQLAQMVRIIDDLLDVARITTGKLVLRRERVMLRDVVQAALDTVTPSVRERGQQLVVRRTDDPLQVDADPTRLAQVFVNLLHNASKFTPAGGRVTFDVRRSGDEAVVTVEDTGIGIAAEQLPLVFDMFAQLDRSLERVHAGLGVGLSLAQRLVEMHGGGITADSGGAGHGSRFTVRLPLAAGAAPTPAVTTPEPAAAAPSPPRGRRVLIADDNEDFAQTFAMLLRHDGHEVAVTHDGAAAIEAAAALPPDVAFLDIGLPHVNGYDVARRLRQARATQGALLVAITGWGQLEDRRRAHDAGFDHHMVKPVDPARVRALLATMVRPATTATE